MRFFVLLLSLAAFPVLSQPIKIGELNSYKVFAAFLEPYKKGMELALEEINAALAPFDQFAIAFSDTAENLHGIVSDLTDQASALKEALYARAELLAQRNQLERSGAHGAAARIVVPEVDRVAALASLRGGSANLSPSAPGGQRSFTISSRKPHRCQIPRKESIEQWKHGRAISRWIAAA